MARLLRVDLAQWGTANAISGRRQPRALSLLTRPALSLANDAILATSWSANLGTTQPLRQAMVARHAVFVSDGTFKPRKVFEVTETREGAVDSRISMDGKIVAVNVREEVSALAAKSTSVADLVGTGLASTMATFLSAQKRAMTVYSTPGEVDGTYALSPDEAPMLAGGTTALLPKRLTKLR